jgi:hypothetical protein
MADNMTVEEVRRELGLSKVTMARLIKEQVIKVEPNPFDRRSKLIRRQDLEKLKKTYPVKTGFKKDKS